MAKQLINLGTVVNDGTGDVLRVGAQKINENFTELYTFLENSSGQLSLVSSITADDGLTANASSGNVLIRANIASTTDLGSIRVGSGLQISEGGVLSIIPQASFNGDYNDLINKPDLSVYQLAANAFSRNYNDLTSKPSIPASLFDLGIASGAPGEILVLNNSNLPEFQPLFNQPLSTTNDVLFNTVTAEEAVTLNTSTEVTEQAIQSQTAQRDNLQNSALPMAQAQYQQAQQNYNTWQGILSSTQPGSPEYYNAMNMMQMFLSQIYNYQGQIASIQNQIGYLNSRIGYLQSTLSKTSTSLVFDHYTMSLVTDVGITVSNVTLPDSNTITVSNGIYVNSAGDLKLNASSKQWLFDTDGIIKLPTDGDIVDSNGDSIIPVPPNQTLNTTSDVTFNSLLTNEILSSGTNIPSIVSATNLKLSAAGVVELDKTPLRLGILNSDERDARTLISGDMFYHQATNPRLQFVQENEIHTVRTTRMSDFGSQIVYDIATCGVDSVDSWSQEEEFGHVYTFYGHSIFLTDVNEDIVYFSFDPEKFTGGVLEFEAQDSVVDTDDNGHMSATIYNRYYGSVKFGHFNDGTQDHFVFEPSVHDALNNSNYNFGASIGRATIPSSKGGIPGIGLGVRQLNPLRGQISMSWRARMFAAKPHLAVIYVVGIPL